MKKTEKREEKEKKIKSKGFLRSDTMHLEKWHSIIVVLCSVFFAALTSWLFFDLRSSNGDEYLAYYNSMRSGFLAEEDVYADKSYYLIDDELSQKLLEAQRKAIAPVFTNSVTAATASTRNASLISSLLAQDRDSFIKDAQQTGLSYEQCLAFYDLFADNPSFNGGLFFEAVQALAHSGYILSDDLDKYAGSFSSVNVSFDYDGIDIVSVDKKSLTTETTVYSFVTQFFDSIGVEKTSDERKVFANAVAAVTVPGLSYNDILTESKRNEISPESCLVVYNIVSGQLLVSKDTVISDSQSRVLYLLGQQTSDRQWRSFVAILIVLLVLTLIVICTNAYVLRKNLHRFPLSMIEIVGAILSTVLAYFLYKLYKALDMVMFESVMPVLSIPLLMSYLTDKRRVGFLMAVLEATAFSLLPGASFASFIYLLCSAMICVLAVTYLKRRREIVIQWIITMVIVCLLTGLWYFLSRSDMKGFWVSIEFSCFNVILTYVFTSIALPILEDVFHIPTSFKLRELADSNSTVLQRLAQEAPGTYSHSMAVADIAEEAARSIGANPILTKVGALFHDIGKMDYAEYYTENKSLSPQNPNDINNNLTVSIIKSHVKLGVEKGRQIKLPQEVLDIIGNHHGNDTVAYFYNDAMMKHMAEPDKYPEPKTVDYAYLGQPPQTPEQAIVMLSDASEAACRSIAKPTPNKIDRMIQTILKKKIVSNQLNDCGMSITELNTVAQSLSQSITGRSHSRIEYPDEVKK